MVSVFSTAIKMVILIFILRIEAQVLATTSTSCPSADQYWNGTSCTSCTKCGPGYGVKTKCSEKQDTECQECWPGYDWSNNTSMEPCIYCINEVSECLEGNFKIIRNCTTTSPTKCKGCAEGHYFDPGYGEHGGCVPCSQPCDGIFQKETRKCETAHDRLCTARDPTELLGKTTTLVPEQTENIPTSTPVPEKTTNSPSSRRSPNAGTKLPAQLNVIKTDDVPEESTGENKLLFLLFLLALIPAVIGVVVVLRCRQRRRSRKPERKNSRSVEQKRPLMSRTPRGLDTLVRDLPVEDRRFISGWLNGQTTDGYYHYQLVSEKLGFKQEEIRQWSRFDNPAEKFLAAFGEMENGTILMLIDASKQVRLTLFASKLEEKFSQENVAGEGQTWV